MKISEEKALEKMFLLKGQELTDFIKNNKEFINVTNEFKKSALFNADVEKTKILLDNGINFQMRDWKNLNALGYAKDQEKIMLILIAGLEKQTDMRFISYKRDDSDFSLISGIKDIKYLQILKEKGFNFNIKIGNGPLIEDSSNLDIYKFIEKETNYITPEYYIPEFSSKETNFYNNKMPMFIKMLGRLKYERSDENKIDIISYIISKNYEVCLKQYNDILESGYLDPQITWQGKISKYQNIIDTNLLDESFKIAQTIYQKKILNSVINIPSINNNLKKRL